MSDVKRVTVGLIPKAQLAMERLQATTGLSQTDLVNRALQFYDWAENEKGGGAEVGLIKDGTFWSAHFF